MRLTRSRVTSRASPRPTRLLPEVAYGYFVADSTDPDALLLYAEMFPEPVPFGTAEEFLGIVCQVKIGDPADYGSATLVA